MADHPAAPDRHPPRRDAASSRKALLDAARREFAAHGLAGARVDRIAAGAGVNKQLVYHYFGGKDDLYREVLEGVYAEIRTLEMRLDLDGLPPQAAIAKLAGFSFDYLARHPDFIALLNDENAQGARHVAGSTRLPEMNSPLVAAIDLSLRRGVAEGVFRDRVDAVELYISIAGLAYFYFSNRRTLSSIFGRKLESRRAIASYRRHVIELVLNGLRVAP